MTSWSEPASRNYGYETQISHTERYLRADEFMEVAKSLWNSWSDDAIVDDKKRGKYLYDSRIRSINHKGEHYNVEGPLNIPRLSLIHI